jgi:DNA-binding Xre family transcriptional regulator
VIKKMGYDWQLRQIMADRGMFQTSDLAGPLAERGITLSREQLWRLVSQPPQRLSLDVLAAMCDILGCGPSDLIEIRVENTSVRKTGTGPPGVAPAPRRTTVRRPHPSA